MILNFFKECRKPSDVYATLQPLFLLSFIIGITPIRISGPPAQRKVEVCFIGFINSLITAGVLSICFITTMINKESLMGYFFTSNVTILADILYKVAGYLGITIIFTSCIFQRNTLIKLINHLAEIDVGLLNLGVSIDYSVSIRFSYIAIIVITFINISYALSTYLLIRSFGVSPSLPALISSCLPHFILAVIVLMFTFFTLQITQRFLIINQILQNLTHDLSDKYSTLRKSESSAKIKTFSIYPIVSKPPSEIINDSMKVHSLLSVAASTTNKYFTYQLLTIIATSFLMILFGIYYNLESILGRSGEQLQFRITEFVILCTCEMILYALAVMAIVEGSSKATNQCQDTALCVHNLLNSTKDESLRGQLSYFSLQLIHYSVHFTAAGLFRIDRTLYFIMAGSATTYLIILLQYSNASSKMSELYNITQAP